MTDWKPFGKMVSYRFLGQAKVEYTIAMIVCFVYHVFFSGLCSKINISVINFDRQKYYKLPAMPPDSTPFFILTMQKLGIMNNLVCFSKTG